MKYIAKFENKIYNYDIQTIIEILYDLSDTGILVNHSKYDNDKMIEFNLILPIDVCSTEYSYNDETDISKLISAISKMKKYDWDLIIECIERIKDAGFKIIWSDFDITYP